MTITEPGFITEPEPPSISGAVMAPEGAPPPAADLGELSSRLSSLEARVATLEGQIKSLEEEEAQYEPQNPPPPRRGRPPAT